MTPTEAKNQTVDTDEVVTRRILIEEFNRMFDEKFKEQSKEWNENTQRYIGAVTEDFKDHVKMLAEGIAMQIEANERNWQEFYALHSGLDKRVSRLEAEVLTP